MSQTSSRRLPIGGRGAAPILRLLIAGGGAPAIASLVPALPGPSEGALRAVTMGLIMVLALLLLRPAARAGAVPLLAWAAAGTLLASLALVLAPTTGLTWPALLRLALTLFLLGSTLLLLTEIIAAPVVILLAAALTLMPVWAAPLVEVTGNPAWLNRIIVWGSPMTALAVAIDLDYLRAEWFYSASALGSMRYTYPGWAWVAMALSVVPAWALFLERPRIVRADHHIMTPRG